MSTSRRVIWVASRTVGTGSPTPGLRYAARSIDPGLTGAHVGHPDRRHRRRRAARDDEADQARLAAVGGDRQHPAAVAVGAGAGRDADQPAVGLGAQPVQRLRPTPRRRTGSAASAGSEVHTWQYDDTAISSVSPCGTSIGSFGQRRMGRVRPTWTGMLTIVVGRVRAAPAPAATSTTTAPGAGVPLGRLDGQRVAPAGPDTDAAGRRGPDPVGGDERHGAAGGVDDVVGQAHPRRPARVDLDHGVLPDERQVVARRGHVERRGRSAAVGVLDPERHDHRLRATRHGDLPVDHLGGRDTHRHEDIGDPQVVGGAVGVVGGREHVGGDGLGVLGGPEGVVDDGRVVEVLGRPEGEGGLRGVDAVGQPVDDLDGPPVGALGCVDQDRSGLALQAYAGLRRRPARRRPGRRPPPGRWPGRRRWRFAPARRRRCRRRPAAAAALPRARPRPARCRWRSRRRRRRRRSRTRRCHRCRDRPGTRWSRRRSGRSGRAPVRSRCRAG